MTTYMHCRPCSGTNISACPCSYVFVHPNYIITSSNYQTYNPTSYDHDQTPSVPVVPRRRRRLEDPIINHASNYYATLPHQMSQSSPQATPPSVSPPPLPPPRRFYQQSNRHGDYCDLFNLLERPSSPSSSVVKQRRKYNCNHDNLRRYHRPINSENIQTRKVKNTNDRKSNYYQSSYYQNKQHQNDILLSTELYDRSPEKSKKTNDIHQRRSSNKGFFRRVVRNYFCMTSAIANSGYSS